jgi:hypothetical protein
VVLHDHTYLHPDAGRGMFAPFYMVVLANALAYAAWFPVVGRLKASVASSTRSAPSTWPPWSACSARSLW